MRVDTSQILAQGGVKVKQGTDALEETAKDADIDDAENGDTEETKSEDFSAQKPNIMRGFEDKSLEFFAAKLAELKMPVRESTAGAMRDLMARHPKLTVDEAAFLAANKIADDESVIKAALGVMSGTDKTHEMLEEILSTIEKTAEQQPEEKKQESVSKEQAAKASGTADVPEMSRDSQPIKTLLSEFITVVVKNADRLLELEAANNLRGEVSVAAEDTASEQPVNSEEVQEKSPEQATVQEKPPAQTTTQERSPEKEIAQEKPSAQTTTQERSPEKEIAQEKPSAQTTTQERPPEKEVAQGKSPEQTTTQERPPGKEVAQGKSPEQIITQERSPEKEIAQEKPPEQTTIQEAQPGKASAQGQTQAENNTKAGNNNALTGQEKSAIPPQQPQASPNIVQEQTTQPPNTVTEKPDIPNIIPSEPQVNITVQNTTKNTKDSASATPAESRQSESVNIRSAVVKMISELPIFQNTPKPALEKFSNMLIRIAGDMGKQTESDPKASATENVENNIKALTAQLEKMITKIGRKNADAGMQLKETREELFARLMLAQEEIERAPLSAKHQLLTQTQKLMDHVKVLNSIEQFSYMQLPVQLRDEQRTAELYVFKRKGGKKTDPDNVNILLSIDLEFMGHWEALLNIKGKNVRLNMEVEGESQREHFIVNTVLLHELLSEEGYKLIDTAINISEEKTTPLTALSALDRYAGGRSGKINFVI